MILGDSHYGATAVELVANRVRLTPATLENTARLAYVGAYLDGLGANAGAALIRAVLYDADDALVTRSEEVTIADGQAVGWVQFTFGDDGGLELPTDDYSVGLHIGGVTNTARALVTDPGSPASRQATDTYNDGTAATLPADSALTANLPVFADVFAPWATPNVEDAALARLPWDLSQRVLGATGPLTSTRRTASCGWHGTTTDPESGANCIVRSDGPLADLVGERLWITRRVGTEERSVSLYCHDEEDFPPEADDEDLSVTRRAWLDLAPWALDSISVSVAVLA